MTSRSVGHDSLNFILKLLNSEFNKNAREFLVIFVNTDISILREMKLERHILSFK